MDCPHFQEESLDQFLTRSGGEALPKPYGGGLELTCRCNLDCRHCYRAEPGEELPTAQWRRLTEEMAEAGVLGVYLTGGEPLSRPDFAEIYTGLRRRGLLVTLFTNGTLLSEEVLALLRRYPPYYVEVSIYGASAETYEQVTRRPGSFAACQEGIERLRRGGIRYLLKTILLRDNRGDFEALQRLAREQGVLLRYDGAITPSLNPGRVPQAQRLAPAEIIEVEAGDEGRRRAWQAWIKEKVGLYKGEALLRCGAGTRTFFVTAAGELWPCLMLNRVRYDWRRGSFAAGLERLREVAQWRRTPTHPCARCPYGVVCEQCPGWSLWVHGDLETPVDNLCQAAHLRVRRFGVGR